MAERNYTITIKLDGEGKSMSPIAGDNKTSDSKIVDKQSGVVAKNQILEVGQKLVAVKAVDSFAKRIINHKVSQVELRTGSSELQDIANFTNSQLQGVKSAAMTIGAGALVGGPVGAVIAVQKVALDMINKAYEISRTKDTLNMQSQLENVSNQMNYIRAGANGSRRR